MILLKIMKATITCLIILYSQKLSAQVKWEKTENWRLYAIHGHGLFDYTIDTLKYFKYYELSRDSIKAFLKDSRIISGDSTPLWMGAYVVSCELDNTKIKLEVSQYGGFFYCEASRIYYELPRDKIKAWLQYFSECYNDLIAH